MKEDNKIDPMEELSKILAEQLSKEIDREIIKSLKPYLRCLTLSYKFGYRLQK